MYDFCDQGCANLDGSYKCTCNEGYYWSGSFGIGCFGKLIISTVNIYFKIVTDINECGYDNGNCSHKCVNMGGTHRCECPAGYFLLPNKRDCVG